MRKIGMTALRRGLEKTIREIDGGEVFLITRRGKPCFVGLDAGFYFALPIYSFWGRGRDISASGFRREMAALADEQGEVVHVHYHPSSVLSYEAVFVPPWVARRAAEEFGSPLREILEETREPQRWRPEVAIWKSNRFRLHIYDAIKEARKGVLGIEKRGQLKAYVVSMQMAKFYLRFLECEWQAREEYIPSSYEEGDRLDLLLNAMRLKPPGIPKALTEPYIPIKELTTTELRDRCGEVLEGPPTVYVVFRYATPVCMVFPVKFYRALWRFVWLWWNSFGDLAELAGKARWALREYCK